VFELGLRLRERMSWWILSSGFSSLLRFVPICPTRAEFRFTFNCNSKCITCNAWKSRSENELTTEEVKNALHQLKEIGIKELIFTGGEPLLRNDIGEIIKEAKALEFQAIIVVTNGLLLERKAEELLDNGVTHIDISIDAINETNDKIRGIPGYYKKAINGIKTIQKLKKNKALDVPVTIMTTLLMKDNINDIPKLVELAKNLDAHILFNLLEASLYIFGGVPLSELMVDDHKKIDETIDYLKTINKKFPGVITQCNYSLDYARNYLKGKNRYNFHCVHGFRMVYLGSHGEIFPCWAMEPIGNIREHKLQDIIGSKKQKELAQKMYKMECPKCTNNYGANILVKHLLSHKLRCKE
jgi:MoaA/NifB/PqqE/SkfB family radical SAM enzyme